MSNPEGKMVPEQLRPIIDELIADRLLTSDPELTTQQWENISELVEPFAFAGPNKPARHVRRKLAFYHIINHALSGQVRPS